VANYDSVATPEGGKAIIQTGLDAFGKIDIVINNAGILRDAAFKNMDAEKLEPVIDVHLKGAFYVTQAAWGVMREQNYGRIVNTSSAAGIFGNFGQTNYGAAKAGLVGFTRVLAVEGAKNNIKANAIAPVAKSRMTEDLLGPLVDKLGPEFITPGSGLAGPRGMPGQRRGLLLRRRPRGPDLHRCHARLHRHGEPHRRRHPRQLRPDPQPRRVRRSGQPHRGAPAHPQGTGRLIARCDGVDRPRRHTNRLQSTRRPPES
jgi:NAD(P)-dependent dehydrogenase (short-subunit alcohol dehydrogenase family)